MSRIYFHSEDGTAEVRGAERAHMGVLSTDLLKASVRLGGFHRPSIMRAIPPDHYLHRLDTYQLNPALETWLNVAMPDHEFVMDGQTHDVFTVALNTALAIGNDAVKLCARLHGQCEIHCYVEGPHRGWLAGVIEQGRRIGLLREAMGWEDVTTLLRARDDAPVVCSYSVCEQFPNAGLAIRAGVWHAPRYDYAYDANGNQRPLAPGEEGELDTDAWYDLSHADQWRLGLAALRQEARGLELTPEGWAAYYFGDGVTGFHVQAWADAQEATV